VFAQLRNGQPLPVRQLAAMMRKRSLIENDPEQVWPQLKAELLGDERSYRTLGLRRASSTAVAICSRPARWR